MPLRYILTCVLGIILLLAASPTNLFAAEQADTERMLRHVTPPISVIKEEVQKKDQWYFDSYYSPSLVLEGTRTGRWDEQTNTFGYTHQNIQGYFSTTAYDRLGTNDYTADFGSYITLKDSYVHFETGFGWDVDYIYDFQVIAEYGHKLIKDLFWQVGYNYRTYRLSDDTHNFYPGLIYYFGDHYISANYGVGWIEARDTANFGVVKGSFLITDFLRYYCGIAFGERLYDIFGLPAHKETGYIGFMGINLTVYKGISARVGCSYGTETPKFIKRSLDFGLNVKF